MEFAVYNLFHTYDMDASLSANLPTSATLASVISGVDLLLVLSPKITAVISLEEPLSIVQGFVRICQGRLQPH
jgi:hypothetical protein